MYDRTTVRPNVQGATFSMRGQLYHGHNLIISPLHGHGEVTNENPLILPRTLSIVGALVLLKRCAGKKKCELRFQACLNLYITSSHGIINEPCVSSNFENIGKTVTTDLTMNLNF